HPTALRRNSAMPPRRTAAAALAVSALIAIGVVAIGAVAINRTSSTFTGNTVVAAAEPVRPAGSPAAQNAQVVPDFAAIVQKYGPAVVNITVTGSRRAGASAIPGMPGGKGEEDQDEDPFSQFFRGLPFRFEQPPSDMPLHGQGSGFIVGADGIVLTN